jgi:hypothetical protein
MVCGVLCMIVLSKRGNPTMSVVRTDSSHILILNAQVVSISYPRLVVVLCVQLVSAEFLFMICFTDCKDRGQYDRNHGMPAPNRHL